MLDIGLWLFLMLGRFGINFQTDCVIVLETPALVQIECILPNGEILPVEIDLSPQVKNQSSKGVNKSSRTRPARSRGSSVTRGRE